MLSAARSLQVTPLSVERAKMMSWSAPMVPPRVLSELQVTTTVPAPSVATMRPHPSPRVSESGVVVDGCGADQVAPLSVEREASTSVSVPMLGPRSSRSSSDAPDDQPVARALGRNRDGVRVTPGVVLEVGVEGRGGRPGGAVVAGTGDQDVPVRAEGAAEVVIRSTRRPPSCRRRPLPPRHCDRRPSRWRHGC